MIKRNNDGDWDDNHDSGVNGISDEDDRLLSSARQANFHFLQKHQFRDKKYHTLTFRKIEFKMIVRPANIPVVYFVA